MFLPLTQAIIIANAMKQCCDGKQLIGFVDPHVQATSLSVKVTGVKSNLNYRRVDCQSMTP